MFAGLERERERERLSDCSAEAGDGAGVVPGVGLSKAACLLIILGPSPKIKNSSGIGYINQLKPVKTSSNQSTRDLVKCIMTQSVKKFIYWKAG